MPREVEAIQGDEWTPTVVFDPRNVREITATNLVDEHQSERKIRADLAEGAEDLGEGFLLHDEPVLIQRDRSGGIVRITPLSEIPGVHFDGSVLSQDPDRLTSQEQEPMVAETKEVPVPLNRSQREKLRHVITKRLFDHYANEASLRNRAKWNPFRDGLPEVPTGAPEFMQPSKDLPLVPATPGQVYDYLLKHVAQRMKVVDRKGQGMLQDMAIRIS